ncbi:HlyC/CorC family transporter [Oceanisphaera arctica]|uniref:Magnesium/cobalt efflux protein n=1 Tax=Oceanisphaera arctica TaxID=641510 RepID=A0A2P5TP22_9GAMM|nr:CNNM domain-containing protein [Oceanisphaera arctica]PPL17392.1 magnesium/cobalt efflux protein [Oceanisphaera arctica]GHA08384.1 transporter [Oceanisphaera arctica]
MDDISTGTLTGILIALLFISAFFSSSETGMMSLNRYRLRHLAQSRHKSALRVEKLLSRPDRLIGLILIGNNLVNILASAIATVIAIRLYGDYGVVIATVALTVVVLIFAEVTPKTLAALYPERVAFPASFLLKPLMVILYPAVWTINAISNGLLALFRINPQGGGDTSISSEELRTIVNEAGALIPRRHQDMLVSILDLEKVTVDDIMVPRNEIYGIDVTQDWKTISRRLMQSPHTKVLLYRDNIDDALGFIHARDALRLLAKDEFSKSNLMRAVRELYYIPEATPLNVQLVKFQRNKERIGLIVDEYGDIQGLVTLDDILEEIVGDFTTTISPTLSDEIKPQDDGSYLIEGSASIRDINKELGWELPSDGPRSLNGLILEYLEDIPEANICLRLSGYPIEILEVENNMVKLVRVLPHYYQG